MNLTKTEIESLEQCWTPEAWREACEAIKHVRGGSYPPDWWPVMKLSGKMDEIMARWGEDSELRFARQKPDGTWEKM